MGAFYSNIALKGPTQDDVVNFLNGRCAAISPGIGGCVAVFDEVCDKQNDHEIRELSSSLSRELRCPAFAALVHDDDLFCYWLFEDGELADEYDSTPGYFDPPPPDMGLMNILEDMRRGVRPARNRTEPKGGDARRLCAAFGLEAAPELEKILRTPHFSEEYICETNRHRDLVRVLGTPPFAVGTALSTFESGIHQPDGLSLEQMRWA